jgi:putative hydrolase of the HAD superfamily
MIDTITFDLWNTLLSNEPRDNERYKQKRLEAIRGLLQENGFDIDFDSLYRAHEKGFEKCKETWNRNLDLSSREQLKIMLSFLDDPGISAVLQTLMPKLEEVFLAPILNDPPALTEGAKKTIDYVRAEGYKIGLICNTGRTPGRIIRELLKNLDMIEHFGALTFSNELRIRKPDPRIFLHTLNELKSDPANSMHVGDELKSDVLGARITGVISVHFNPNQIFYRQIQPDFSIKELIELKTLLAKTKGPFSDVNN